MLTGYMKILKNFFRNDKSAQGLVLKKKKKKGALIFYKVIHTEVFMDEI